MGVQLHKTSHLILFLVILPALSALLAWGVSRLIAAAVPAHLIFLVDSVGALGAFGLLYKAFDLWAWRWRLFRLTGVVEVPVVAGRWVGQLKSSSDGHSTTYDAALEIKQSFNRVTVAMYFANSRSASVVAGFAEEPDGTLALHYEYQNVPDVDAAATMHIHYGTAKLHCVPGETRLSGSYYNWGRDERGHVGTMALAFESETLVHRLKK
jgi:hypothetical protein